MRRNRVWNRWGAEILVYSAAYRGFFWGITVIASRMMGLVAGGILVAGLFLAQGAADAQAAPAAAAPATPTTAANAAAKRLLTVDDYFRFKEVDDPQVSPDGKWVSYTVKTANLKDDKNNERIWMVPASGGTAMALTAEKSSSSHGRWSPDGKYLAFLSARGGGKDEDADEAKSQVWILNLLGGEGQQLTDTTQEVKDFRWSPAGDRLALVLQDPSPEEIEAAKHKDDSKAKAKPRPWVIDRLHFKEDEAGYLNRRRSHVYVFTLADKKVTQITSGDYDDEGPAWSPDGTKIAFASNRSAPDPDLNFNTDIWVADAGNTDRGKTLVQVTTNEGAEESPAWSPDGKWIAYTTQLEPKLFDYSTIQIAVSPAGGGEAKILTRKLDRNSTIPKFSADGKWIYFIADDDGTQNLLRVPAAGGEIERPIGGRRMVQAYALGKDGSVAATVADLTQLAEVYDLPAGSSELKRLTTTNDAVMAELRLPEVEYVHFKSKDGTLVAGYLYKPVGYEAGKKYPTILRPHGGPVWAYYAEFHFDANLFAANGYAVLTPNPRGSSGYGLDYAKAIFADWGHKDFEDDMAMVDYAVAQGIADPDKLGVGGWSYGGISTNFIIAQTTRFKAAISGAGEFLYVTNWGHDLYSRGWEYELGLPWENRAVWEKLSPFNRVTAIKTPTMIMGGDADGNVPVINGEQMYQSLRRLGVPTVLVVYPGEFHEFTRPTFIKDRYERDLYWYGHWVKGEGPEMPPAEKEAD
ncbi:MAG TPA: S9 family peptidase [Candidatus Acidoferrales bacterium]